MADILIECVSWNCRGLHKVIKIKQVMNRIKQLKAKIVFLQETHLLANETAKIKHRWPGRVLSASYSTNSRGVMILIHKSIPLQIEGVIDDSNGRFLIIQGRLLSTQVNLINIYGPNNDDVNFFNDLFLRITALPGKYIIAGDFNCVLDPRKDRSLAVDSTHTRSRKALHCFIKELNLIDIWRHLNPSKKEFSCYSSTHKSYSRIDYFLVSAKLLSNIRGCHYNSIVISDHAAVSMIYVKPKSPKWRFQTKWMQDSKFLQFSGE